MKTGSKKIKLKKLDKKTEEMFKASSVAVLLENMNDNIVLLAEGQATLNNRFDGLEARFDRLEARFDGLEARFDRLEREMKQGFSMVMGHLKITDEEIVEIKKELLILKENKIGMDAYSLLEERIKKAEKRIEEVEVVVKEKKIKV